MMTVEEFLVLLMSLSALSSLATEGIKKLLPKWPSNATAAVTALLIGVGWMIFREAVSGGGVTSTAIIWGVLLGLACALCSMVGYDKAKQALKQMMS